VSRAIVADEAEGDRAMPATIGFLSSTPSVGFEHLLRAFLAGLRMNEIENMDVVTLEAWAGGDYDRLDGLASCLIGHDVNLLVAAGGIVAAQAAINAAKKKNIRVLYVMGRDSAQDKLDYDNGKGINVKTSDLVKNRHDDLKTILGQNAKIFLLVNPRTRVAEQEEEEFKKFGGKDEASTLSGLHQAFQRLKDKENADGVIISADPHYNSQRQTVVELAAKHGIAASYPWSEYVEAGGLIGLGPDLRRVYMNLGRMAAESLSGKSLAELDQFSDAGTPKLAINLRTALALGRDIPDRLMSNADILVY
jgi:ABC-type uncharacterized transport system substrate-binding protein